LDNGVIRLFFGCRSERVLSELARLAQKGKIQIGDSERILNSSLDLGVQDFKFRAQANESCDLA